MAEDESRAAPTSAVAADGPAIQDMLLQIATELAEMQTEMLLCEEVALLKSHLDGILEVLAEIRLQIK